jgi:hypothetical protein
LEEKVNEFAELNYLLDEQLRTFTIDEAPAIVAPVQILEIKPNVVDTEIIEEKLLKNK